MPFDALPEGPRNNSDLLEIARSHIAKGWIQHHYMKDGSVCAVAALSLATGHRYPAKPSEQDRRLAELLVRELPSHGGIVLRCCTSAHFRVRFFNDRRRTRKEDVLAMFDRAIIRQRANEWQLLTGQAGR